MIQVSYSQLSKFATCPTQWDISQRWKPKEDSKALILGQSFHAACARAYAQKDISAGENYLKQLCASVEKKSDSAYALYSTLASYQIYAAKILRYDLERFDVLEVEGESELAVEGHGVIKAVVDLVLQDKRSKVRYILDHKYKADFDDSLPERDDQGTIYTASLLKKYGALLPMVYNVTRKPLYRTKTGEAADAFGMRCYTSMDEEEKGFKYDPLSYKSRFFIRQAYTRGRLHMQEALARIRGLMSVMEWVRDGQGKAWINPGDWCRWCSVRALCPVEDDMVGRSLFVRKRDTQEIEKEESDE